MDDGALVTAAGGIELEWSEDDFHGYDFKELEVIYTNVLRRRAKRGVKSIRNPRGYYLLASRYARKEPLPLHVIERKPNVMVAPSKKISSFAAAYVDPNILEYIRAEWWPLAHFNPISFKRDHDIPITKDDYTRFSAKLFRGLLPDIGFPEVLRLLENDWTIDIHLDEVDEETLSGLMDFNLFAISLLDLATACTAGALDTIYLFLQETKIKFRLAHDFAELPKLHYDELSQLDEHGKTDRSAIHIDHGKTYSHTLQPGFSGPLPSYHINLFPTKLALIALFLSLDETPLNFVVRAIDSSGATRDAEWRMEGVPAAVLVYKPSDADITNLQYETLTVRVVPRTGITHEVTYHAICVLQNPANLVYKADFYGSIAAKRVRVFSLNHEQNEVAHVTLTTEPAVKSLADEGSLIGCVYVVKHDVTGVASYRYQTHALLFGAQTRQLHSAPMNGLYYVVLYSLIELHFVLEYNERVIDHAPTSGVDEHRSAETTMEPTKSVAHREGGMPYFYQGEKIDVRARPPPSLRSRIYSARLRTRHDQQTKLDDEHRQQILEHIKKPAPAREWSPRPVTANAKRNARADVEVARCYFAHMATTQPTLQELRAKATLKAARLQALHELKGHFDTVYSEDEQFRRIAKAPTENEELRHGVFAAEEYESTAAYLGSLLYDVGTAKSVKSLADQHEERYVASPTKAFSTPMELSDVQQELIQKRLLRLPLNRPTKTSISMVLPKQLESVDLPWLPSWQVEACEPPPRCSLKASPPKNVPKPVCLSVQNDAPSDAQMQPVLADFSIVTSILARQTAPDDEPSPPTNAATSSPGSLPAWEDMALILPKSSTKPSQPPVEVKRRSHRRKTKAIILKLPWSRLHSNPPVPSILPSWEKQ
ncbi:hypothetical protein ACHHYP_06070 [Achlya hypogyna]|uniref:Uncharacterized protein n=1 Tax=Achlya hypogyna TaxID=1202772 RepID=A0A1V9ZN84_ACHHY|nr:hypothetical protein ACHHYP_06070 [Achlya hypogyna]